ncbi:MAG: zf-HC2 domain-containing protein [Opitutaceae bacterium]
MNCREATPQIFAERDGALDETQRAALAEHLTQCTGCQKMRDSFATAVDALRHSTEQVRVPDAELEWQKLRREIRGGAGSTAAASTRRMAWFGLPLAAAAAAAVALFMNTGPTNQTGATDQQRTAIAKGADPAGASPSTVVFVDDKSGYVFVWADDTKSI